VLKTQELKKGYWVYAMRELPGQSRKPDAVAHGSPFETSELEPGKHDPLRIGKTT